MASLLPYKPIQAPPGGLLATTVGTPQAPLPPIEPYKMEDDSVVGQLNSITDAGSSYIKQAEAAGARTAQRRGLLNSSMAAGASRGAAINAAAPLAMQEAQQRAQRNLTRLDNTFQTDRLSLSIASNEKMQGLDLASREKLQADALAAESERLGRQLTAQEQAQLRDITNQQFMQTRDIENRTNLTQMELAAREKLQTDALAAESERLGRQLTAQEQQQVRDIASREGMLTTELANRTQLAREEAASLLERLGMTTEAENLRANLNAATQVQLQTLQNLNAQQQSTLQYYSSMAGNYLQAISSVWNNENIPAPARQAAIDQFASVLTSGINMPAALYGTQLNWGGVPTAPATGVAPVSTTVPIAAAGPTPAEIEAMRNDGIDGNYAAATSGTGGGGGLIDYFRRAAL